MAQSNTLSEQMLYACQLSYMFSDGSTDIDRLNIVDFYMDGYELDTNFDVDGHFSDTDTGLEVVALKNTATNEYILAFAGTQSALGNQDWAQNLKLGWDQWGG